MLSVFSIYGWQVEDSTDPQVPRGSPAADWTRILYHASARGLERRETPAGTNSFPAAAVEFVPILSLPTHRREPVRAALDISEDDQQRFQALLGTFETVTRYHLGNPPNHQLLGDASYEQTFLEEVAEQGLRLVFQLASDNRAAMCWGDGGYLYFWARPADIETRDFSRVVTDYQ